MRLSVHRKTFTRDEAFTVHAQHLLPYATNQNENLSIKNRSNTPNILTPRKKLIDTLHDVRRNKGTYETSIQCLIWNRFDYLTWEPDTTYRKDVPGLVKAFLNKARYRNMNKKI